MKTNTIKQVVRETFELMPETFNTVEFIATVKTHCSVRLNKFPFDSTILRQLRELRTDDPMKYDWQCIDHAKSVYQKIDWKNETVDKIAFFKETQSGLEYVSDLEHSPNSVKTAIDAMSYTELVEALKSEYEPGVIKMLKVRIQNIEREMPKNTIGGGNYATELKGYSPENNLPKQNIFQKLFNKK